MRNLKPRRRVFELDQFLFQSAVNTVLHEEYVCPGPGWSGGPAFLDKEVPVGQMMTMDKCLDYPNCGCRRYIEQCNKYEEALNNEEPDEEDEGV